MSIELLDCTLRDGGHQNGGKFGEQVIRRILNNLQHSGLEYVEVGFLRNKGVGYDYAAENDIHAWEKRFPEIKKQNGYKAVLMIQQDQYDIKQLPQYDGRGIGIIRVSFHDYDRNEGLNYVNEVVKKGYQCFVNPINLVGYSDSEILDLVKATNQIGAKGFTVVDTFGSLNKDDLLRIYMLVNHNLRSDMTIGAHFHDNLRMAFALAQAMTEVASDERSIIIDGSLLGMGREPGNLCVELMMEYLNRKVGKRYEVDTALDLIDNDIASLKTAYPWGYETAYSLSAQYRMHRSYAEYLMKKQKLKTSQIRQILGSVQKDKKSKYDERYIEKLYADFISSEVDDSDFRRQLKMEIGERKVLLLAPGNTLREFIPRLINEFDREEWVVIAANFITETDREDYVFCSNQRRLEQIESNPNIIPLILTSNIKDVGGVGMNVVNVNDLGWFSNVFWDNCMLMLFMLI